MQALEVFCSCWFTFEVRWLKLSMLWTGLLCTKNSLGLIFEVVYKGISHACLKLKLNCVSVKQTIKIIYFKMIINMYMAVLISRWRFIKGKSLMSLQGWRKRHFKYSWKIATCYTVKAGNTEQRITPKIYGAGSEKKTEKQVVKEDTGTTSQRLTE